MENLQNDLQEINPELLMQKIKENESKNLFLIKGEMIISNIISFLSETKFNNSEKSLIIKYLIKCLANIPLNIEIILRQKFKENNLYQIIIHEYIINQDKKEYIEDLRLLLTEMLKIVGYNKDMYRYLISYISDYFNKKALLENSEVKNKESIPFDEKIKFNDFNSSHLLAILELIYTFFEQGRKVKEPSSYLYFSGEEKCNIMINNTSLIESKNDIYIMLYISLFDKQYLDKFDYFSLLEIKLNDNTSININISNEKKEQNKENKCINIPYEYFKKNEINQVIIKISKNKNILISLNFTLQDVDEVSINQKQQITSLIFFQKFIGLCSNIIIYKSQISNEIFIPKFLQKEIYKNGINNEELFAPFVRGQFTFSVDETHLTDKVLTKLKDSDISEFKSFYSYNLLSLYMPDRYQLSPDEKNIVLIDTINNINATLNFNDEKKCGVHTLSKTIQAFYDLGSINHLLPIIELITKEKIFCTGKIFDKYIDIIIYIFSNLSDYFKLFDKNAPFFFYLSYFLEKIEDKNGEIFNKELCNKLIELNNTFIKNKDNNNYKLFIKNFNEHIFLNEKIIFKFNYELQKEIINEITNSIIKDKSKADEISIIKCIKILLYYDSHQNNKYCCKEHAQYFINDTNKSIEISQPELNDIIEPIINLIKELFKLYLSNYKNININNSTNNNNAQKTSDYNLDKFIEILTFDISPCLQKTILNLFFDLKNYTKELNHLNKNAKIFSILLFILKTTIYNDIRLLVYDFIFILLNDKNFNTNFDTTNNNNNKNNTKNNSNTNITQYIESIILPFYLFMDEKDKNPEVKNTVGQEEKIINNIKYNYLILSEEENILNTNYKKEILDELITVFFEKVYNNFYQGTNIKNNLNILIKIVSKGNALLIFDFLDKLNLIITTRDIKLVRLLTKQQNEILLNINLFHWILETYFHIYLLKEQIKGKIKAEFNYGIIFPNNINMKEKNEKIDKMLVICNNIVIKILNNDINKLDYVLTLSKYYFSLVEDTNNLGLIHDFVYDLIFNKMITNIKEIYMSNISFNKVQRMSLYFYNIIFEYYTFLKIKTPLNYKGQEDIDNLYQEIGSNFRFNILNEMQKDLRENKTDDIYEIFSKSQVYIFMKKVFNLFTPLWKEENKTKLDKNFYTTYIHHKQNISVFELELLFFEFNDIKSSKLDNIYSLGNTGVPLIYMLFHQFTIFLMTNDKNEFKEIIKHFRYFISLIITSSVTLTVSKNKNANANAGTRDKDKINWPNEEQYKNIQSNVKLILFNFIYFMYYRIKEINDNIKNNPNDKNKIENFKIIKKYLCDTLCYFLKIFNIILIERTKKIEDNKKQNIKVFFKAIKNMITNKADGVELTGVYNFFYEFYAKCLIKNHNYNISKKLGETSDIINTFILSSRSFLDDIPFFNIDDFLKENASYNKIYTKLEEITNKLMEIKEIKTYLDENILEYQKVLFPFIKTIFNRKELVSQVIPIYDNSPYCNYNNDIYNSLCLNPNYFPIYSCEKSNLNNIKKINSLISDEIRIMNIKQYLNKYEQNTKYYKLKKRLFIFKGIWSKQQFYYDKKNYQLKYKVFNHLTEEFMKLFLTPIIDIDYYLPKFSSFKTQNLFRIDKDSNTISLEKIVDLSSDLIEENIDTEHDNINKEETQETNIENQEDKKTEGDNGNNEKINSNKTEEMKEENKEKELISNNISIIKKLNYNFVEDLSFKKIQNNKLNNYKLITKYIRKMNFVDVKNHQSIDPCCLVKSSFHIKGLFYNNFSEIGFYGYSKIPSSSFAKDMSNLNEQEEDLEYDPERKSCFGSVFRSQKEKYDGYYLKIPYNQIAFVFKRRYFFKTIALEVYTLKNKNYYFKFSEKDAKKVYDNIKTRMKSVIEDIQIEYSKNDSKIGFVNNNDNNNLFMNSNMLMYKKKDMNLKNLYEKWQNWEMSTFKFLMFCNMYSNRSLNDINQYPVYPWIITNYTDKELSLEKENTFRPFGVPMGMMDLTPKSEERKEEFLTLWQNLESNDPNCGRYGVHYSTSTYVSYYMVRIFPFSNIKIEMQGDKFDDPNRLFLRMDINFDNAMSQKTDLRELIPEMFTFPEMFYNKNRLELGKLDENLDKNENKDSNTDNNGILVDDVGLPPWCDNDGYKFIKKHREILESTKVSEKINEWFNIIFGSKQKGKEAKKINNLFQEQTYEDYEEKYNKLPISDKMDVNRMVEFGVTPNQIFKSDTSKRKVYSDLKISKNFLYNSISKNIDNLILDEIEIDFDREIPYRIFEDGEKKLRMFILTKKNVKIYSRHMEIDKEILAIKDNLTNNNNVQKDNTKTKINMVKKGDIIMPQYGNRLPNNRIYYEYSVIFAKGKYIALGGYYNGNIVVKSLDYKIKDKEGTKSIYIYSTNENSPIVKLIIDESNTYAICANNLGTIFIFIISQEQKFIWILSKVITHQKPEGVSALSICEKLNIFISCSNTGNCNIYSLPRIKLFNSFNIQKENESEKINCNLIFIYHTPLPCFIFYIKNLNSFYVYSINGKFLQKNKIEYDINANGIAQYIDYQMRDYLMIYNSKDKTIDIHRAIDFTFVTKSPVINYDFIGFAMNQPYNHALVLVKESEKENKNKNFGIKYKIIVLKDKNEDLIWK